MSLQHNSQTQPHVAAHPHPTVRTFLLVGLVLFVITATEFGIIFVQGMRNAIVAILLLLSACKFVLVARYFMHLKFDNRVLTWVFYFGVILASLIAVAQMYVNQA